MLSRSFVPALCSLWLKAHFAARREEHRGADYQHRSEHEHEHPKSWFSSAFERWEAMISTAIAGYVRLLDQVMKQRALVLGGGFALLLIVVLGFGSQLRREFFPEVDAGAFEIYVRGKTGLRIEETEKRIARVEAFLKEKLGDDLELVISEIGVVADWSAAYTPNSRPDGFRGQGPTQARSATLGPRMRPSVATGLCRYVAI